ncbi:BQ5605_C026g10225 [Microbotryum silenes-dioicae]|uniref:BQ5605_C026g10225 protein n=1 Tax=Microbotryum silenes-dioicae TaxID=796604 RepID=A0A2X0MRJ2_9BASI|nr:BQ5605_C026g10225 [Microbotryum silenes-dioicae]
MSHVGTNTEARGPPRRHPSFEFRASPLRSASSLKGQSYDPSTESLTKPTTVLGHWRPRLTHE